MINSAFREDISLAQFRLYSRTANLELSMDLGEKPKSDDAEE